MRKVLLFLTLFGLGFAALLLLRQRAPRPGPATPDLGTPSPTEQFTEIPLSQKESGGQGGSIPVLLRGEIDVTQFETAGVERKPVRKLHADDSQSLGGNVYVLRGMRIEILDPTTGKTTAKLTSPRTRLKIEVVGGKATFGEGDKALLNDVEATLYEKAPVVPLTFDVSLLEWQIGNNHWTSEEPVKIFGPGLRVSGDGLDADLTTGQFVIPSSGSIELDLPKEVRVTLAATGTGPITVRKLVVEGQDHVELVASDGARFSASGTEPLRLDATEIRMLARGRVEEGGAPGQDFVLRSVDAQGRVVAVSRGDTFRSDRAAFRVTPEGRLEHADLHGAVSLEREDGSVRGNDATFDFSSTGLPSHAHVEGETVLRHGEDVFRARSADFEFGPDGKLTKATLVGDPSGSVAIGRFLPPDQLDLRAAHAELSGPGPLVLEFTERTKIELTGPGELKIPEADLVIHAERSFLGEAQVDHKTGNVTADGAVKITWGADDLQSDRVTLFTSLDPAGQTVVDSEAFGPTTIHRTLADGAKASLAATDGLQLRSAGKKVVVPIARGVDLSAVGPRPFHARAATVKDLDWEARAFVAEGDVSLEGDLGNGTADRVVARGPDDIELTGSAGKPARFSRAGGAGEDRFEEAKIEGLSIHAREDALDATGEVRTDFLASDASYHVEGSEVHVAFDPPSAPPSPGFSAARPFRARASTAVHAWVQTLRGESTLSCDELRVTGVTKPRKKSGDAAAGNRPEIVASDVRAEGTVVVDWSAQGGIAGVGDLFVLDPEGRGRLSAEPGRRVRASGRLAPDAPAYDLDAEWVEFDPKRLEAHGVDLRLQAGGPGVVTVPGQSKPLLAHLTADHLRATPNELLLEGHAHADGLSEKGESWSFNAGSLRIGGKFKEKGGLSPADFELIQAWDGFEAKLGDRGRAKGTRIESRAGTIRLEGKPAELELGPIVMRSEWIEYGTENMLLASDKGVLRSADDVDASWSLTYEALQPFDREDKTILALRNPVFLDGETEMSSSWMLFWVDREEWRRSGRKAMGQTGSEPDLRAQKLPEETPMAPAKGAQGKKKPGAPKGKLGPLKAGIAQMRANPISKVLSEVYVGGNIELTKSGARRARASAIYLDVVDGHGWIRDADFLSVVGVRGRTQQLRVRADWLRVSSDLSLRADKATLSFCDYDEPHYVVETGDLRLKPTAKGGNMPYNVSATHNALRFENGWGIPLPPLVYEEDEEGNPIVENLNLGQSAQFGASIGATFNVGLGKVGNGIGKAFGALLSLPKDSVKGHWSLHANYLGSRGFLVGTGLQLRSGDRFKFEAEFSAIPDTNEDRGLVRVPEDDRSLLRDWFRARGRYTVEKGEWFDTAISVQSDPGVQSEFFEGDYLRYEQKDNYLHWRKASDAWYYSASVKVLLEERTDTEELPKAGIFRARAPIGKLGSLDVLYTGYLDAAYLRRREGNTDFVEPGEVIPPDYRPFPDGLGDRDVARVDTTHRFETPFNLGFAGLRATPWLLGRATAWDQGVDPDSSPERFTAIAGFDLSTTFWKYYSQNLLHTLSPFASVHGDFASHDSGGDPVFFDPTEAPVTGQFVDVGLRSRIFNPATKSRFDVELRATHAEDLPNNQPGGLQPVGALGELLTWMGNVPVGVSHDGRYDFMDGQTPYSRSFLGIRPHPKWDLEFGYHHGNGVINEVGVTNPYPYNAYSAGVRYRATKKWELEVSETVAANSDQNLASSFILRRLGHDFITQIELGNVAGQGSQFSINLTPLLTWKPGTFGLMDRWLGP